MTQASIYFLHQLYNVPKVSKWDIGIVTCVGNKSSLAVHYSQQWKELLVLLKSIHISASANKVENIRIHAFVDHTVLKSSIKRLVQSYSSTFTVKIEVETYSVFDTVPQKYHNLFGLPKKCNNVRLFFPDVLTNLNKILYFDTDTIVIGNISAVWQTFGQMNHRQIAAAGRNNEAVDKHYGPEDKYHFGDIPHVEPKGINSGVFFMDLEKMRKFEWTTKIVKFYEDYTHSKHRMSDQRVINILFAHYPNAIKVIPCSFNFMHTHCGYGLTCNSFVNDEIHVLHGAGSQFESYWAPFFLIFKQYYKFNVSDNVEQKLFRPLKRFYRSTGGFRTCGRRIWKYLFKNVTT
ncbi:unnamed protein product [Orchesella dallaii]|uniref:UDP-D-xylose:beta-D-glucoside alpha-1,3-D-xylosyltransferase n=1 Tax=Orchesella dallaii TaxID=48710 RepID=A0ABP1QGK0_9HEXA